jgi:arylsulfatase A-like enzyme
LFEQAITAAPWTLPAFASIFTGKYPGQLRIDGRRRLDPSVPTLAGLLAEEGYATFGITGNIWLGPAFGLTRGFGRFHRLWQLFQAPEEMSRTAALLRSEGEPVESSGRLGRIQHRLRGNAARNLLNAMYGRWWSFRRDYGASRTARPLLRWLQAQRSPWFACIHYLEAHLQYRPPRAWARRFSGDWSRTRDLYGQDQWRRAWRHMVGAELLSEAELRAWRDLYLAEVAYADHRMGALLRELRAAGAMDGTLVAITADHGESLGEHGLLNHQYGLYDSLLRVPMVLHYPDAFAAGLRVPGQVQTLDLFRTLLDIAEVEPPPTPSQSLVPGCAPQRALTVAEYGTPRMPDVQRLRRYGLHPDQVKPFLRGLTALRTDEYKLIEGTDGSLELYDRKDSEEAHDLVAEEPTRAQELQAQLSRFREQHGIGPGAGAPADEEMDPISAARLKGLGYLE